MVLYRGCSSMGKGRGKKVSRDFVLKREYYGEITP